MVKDSALAASNKIAGGAIALFVIAILNLSCSANDTDNAMNAASPTATTLDAETTLPASAETPSPNTTQEPHPVAADPDFANRNGPFTIGDETSYNWKFFDRCHGKLAYNEALDMAWHICGDGSVEFIASTTGTVFTDPAIPGRYIDILFDGTAVYFEEVPSTATSDSRSYREIRDFGSDEILHAGTSPMSESLPVLVGGYLRRAHRSETSIFDLNGNRIWSDQGDGINPYRVVQGALLHQTQDGDPKTLSRIDPATQSSVWTLTGYRLNDDQISPIGYVYAINDNTNSRLRSIIDLQTGEVAEAPVDSVSCTSAFSECPSGWPSHIQIGDRQWIANNGFLAELNDQGDEISSTRVNGGCRFIAANNGLLAQCHNEIFRYTLNG